MLPAPTAPSAPPSDSPRQASAARARAAFLARFEREVDPDNQLDPAEREMRARYALRAHMAAVRLARTRKKAEPGADIAARFEDYIKRLVDASPPLTAEQRARLAVLLLKQDVA